MSDSFLEREKELMKLNESLNTKMTFDLKQPKAVNFKTTNKIRKPTANKSIRREINQAKIRVKELNKLKNDECDDITKPILNASTPIQHDATNVTNIAECNDRKHAAPEQTPVDKMTHQLVETIEMAIDTKVASTADHLSLIPSSIFRKNVSSEGIIK